MLETEGRSVAPDVIILLLRLALVAVIYLFLLQVVIVLWRDLRAPAMTHRSPAIVGLEVIEPGASGRRAGEVFGLQPISSLGRGQENTIVLADPSVSAHHALLSFRLGQWWLEDLLSTNGTHINGVRLEQPTILVTGDVVRLGAVSLRARL